MLRHAIVATLGLAAVAVADTGSDTWSEVAFKRALQNGVIRSGLYKHHTHVNDADIAALCALMTTRRPVSAQTLTTRLPSPLAAVIANALAEAAKVRIPASGSRRYHMGG